MDYEIVMPQLSDSMQDGKLIEWKISIGDKVKVGDVVAEVESDKAIMEVQSFKEGVVKEISIKAGESAKVGTTIAIIQTDKQNTTNISKQLSKTIPTPPKDISHKPKHTQNKILSHKTKQSNSASPKAKALANRYDIDISNFSSTHPIHKKDIQNYINKKYFTPKAWYLIKQYDIDIDDFVLNRKYKSIDIINYLLSHQISKKVDVSMYQQAIVDMVNNSSKKPIFHIYEKLDATLLQRYSKHYSISILLLKLFATALMKHPKFRMQYINNQFRMYDYSSISLAISYQEKLYMVVFRGIEQMSFVQIQACMDDYKHKISTNQLTTNDIKGSTFGISNLGMYGIDRFDAMIYDDDSAIVAIGAIENGQISITFTIDHRIINGVDAAKFVQTIKILAKDTQFFQRNM